MFRQMLQGQVGILMVDADSLVVTFLHSPDTVCCLDTVPAPLVTFRSPIAMIYTVPDPLPTVGAPRERVNTVYYCIQYNNNNNGPVSPIAYACIVDRCMMML